MLRDWSFEARAYLEEHSELESTQRQHVTPEPWPNQAPKPVRSTSALQQASMDPTGVASMPLHDRQAWKISSSGQVG
jgi:hypothetical protein